MAVDPVSSLDVVGEGLVGPGSVWSVRVGWAYLVVIGRALELETTALNVDIDFIRVRRVSGLPSRYVVRFSRV